MAFCAAILSSCMGGGYADAVHEETKVTSPYGNNSIEQTNIITIAQLKSDYKGIINNSGFKKIDKDIKIKGRVTGNDIGGNLYQEVTLQDETGALLVCINGSGLYGYLPVGQEVLIDLNGLYIGGYGKMTEIGGVYTNLKTGANSIGKMDRVTWGEHFRLLGTADASKVEPIEFDMSKISDATYLEENAGKLMTIKGVQFVNGGISRFAPGDNTTNQSLINYSTGKTISSNSLVVRTSGYAKFACDTLPADPVNITGIFTRYNNIWQILIRSTDDITKAVIDKSGTAEQPYTVSQALSIINAGTYTANKVYTTGIISKIESVDTGSDGNATYYISVDGKTTSNQLKVFRGYNVGGEKWTEATKSTLAVGKTVVVYGVLTSYNGEAEINRGNQLISIK